MRRHLKRTQYSLSENVWLYEDMNGLNVIAETKSGKIESLIIPISKIRGYINRRDTKGKNHETN